jgi:hypothetical protein
MATAAPSRLTKEEIVSLGYLEMRSTAGETEALEKSSLSDLVDLARAVG